MGRSFSIVILCFIFLMSGCSSRSEAPLRIGTPLWPGYEPLHLAEAMDFFDREAISLIDSPSPHGSIQGLRNGALDAVALTLDEVLALIDQGHALKVVLIFDFSNGGDAIVAANEITSVGELKGKNVGLESTALGTYVLTRALDLSALTLEDVVTVPVKVSGQSQALADGRVDAVVTFDPVRSELLAAGAREIFTSRDIPHEIVDVLAVSEEYLENNPERVRELIKAWYRALDYLAQEPRHAATIIGQRLQQGADEALASMNGIQLPTYVETLALMEGTVEGEVRLVKSAERLANLMLEMNLLSSKPDVRSIITTKYLK